jgi:predicted DNA-binding transcriptional regulator AlpA
MESLYHPTLADLVSSPSKVGRARVEAIPELRAELARLDLLLESHFIRQVLGAGSKADDPRDATDKLLAATEAALLLGVTSRWLYRHWKTLPFARRLSRKTLRFSEAGIRRYMAAKHA